MGGGAHIVRIDKGGPNGNGATHGWQVRVGPARGYHSKLFSDNVWGSQGKALVAAEEYLDEYLKEHPELASKEPPPYHSKASQRNTSGTVGVVRSHEYLDSSEISHYWAATFPINAYGNHDSRVFRISIYGEEGAELLATAYRKAWEIACDAGELDKFFTEEQTRKEDQFYYPRCYMERPDLYGRKVHIQRRLGMFWCGKPFECPPWDKLESGQPVYEETCRDCYLMTNKFERLVNQLLAYKTLTDEDISVLLDSIKQAEQ